MMKGLVFWTEGPAGMAEELWQEPLRFFCEALSETFPVWLLRWYWNHTVPAYHMEIWDARGREITFWGTWKSQEIAHLLTHYWHIEGFMPVMIVRVCSQKTQPLLYWKKHFRIPTVELFSAEGIRHWPHSGLGQEPVSGTKRLLIPLDAGSAEKAYQIGSVLLERGWSILFVGWARSVTPFRYLHSRYPKQVAIYLGLSWLELEGLMDTCKAVVLPAPRPLLMALGWGMPVFYPGPPPWEAEGVYSYNTPEELLSLLARPDLSASAQKTPAEIASAWIREYEGISTRLIV